MKLILIFGLTVFTSFANAEALLRPEGGFDISLIRNKTYKASCLIPGFSPSRAVIDLSTFRDALGVAFRTYNLTPYRGNEPYSQYAWPLNMHLMGYGANPNNDPAWTDDAAMEATRQSYISNCVVDVPLKIDTDNKFKEIEQTHYANIKSLFEGLPPKFANDPNTRALIEEIVRKVVQEEMAKRKQ